MAASGLAEAVDAPILSAPLQDRRFLTLDQESVDARSPALDCRPGPEAGIFRERAGGGEEDGNGEFLRVADRVEGERPVGRQRLAEHGVDVAGESPERGAGGIFGIEPVTELPPAEIVCCPAEGGIEGEATGAGERALHDRSPASCAPCGVQLASSRGSA